MFERFSTSSRQAVVMAQAAARELRHPKIDSAHLLLGVLAEDDRMAAILTAQGAPEAAVRAQLPPGDSPVEGQIPFTPPAKRALQRALRESMDLRAKVITPGHVLLALAGDRDGRAGAVLRELGVDLARLRDALLAELTVQRRRAGLPVPGRSFVEELTLALRHAEEMARTEHRPVDAGDLLLALGVSPLAAYAIRTTGVAEAIADAREGYGRLEQMRRDMRDAFAAGELAEAERLRDDARRLRDELEGRP